MKSSYLHIPRWVATVVVLVALIGGGILAIALRDWSGHEVFGAPNLALTMARSSTPVSLGSFSNGFASVLKPALPAVVNIHTSKVVKSRASQMMPFFNDPAFRQFFGDQGPQGQGQQPQTEREQSLGSGVIITSDGMIVTNNHVIEGATDIKVDLSDKREFQAKLIGTDAKTDIAVLKIEAFGSAHACDRRFLETASRRHDLRDRRSLRIGGHGDDGNRQRDGTGRPGNRELRRLHPDRRSDQSGQLRRRHD